LGLKEGLKETEIGPGRKTEHPAGKRHKIENGYLRGGGKAGPFEREENKEDKEAVVCSSPSCDLEQVGGGEPEGREVEEERVVALMRDWWIAWKLMD
jgi:hypothetical protein